MIWRGWCDEANGVEDGSGVVRSDRDIIFLTRREPGCYVYMNDNELLYIGASRCIDDRIKVHNWDARIPFNRYEVMEVEFDKLFETEAILIKKHQPPYNLRHTDKYEYARPETVAETDLSDLEDIFARDLAEERI